MLRQVNFILRITKLKSENIKITDSSQLMGGGGQGSFKKWQKYAKYYTFLLLKCNMIENLHDIFFMRLTVTPYLSNGVQTAEFLSDTVRYHSALIHEIKVEKIR